VAEGDDVATSGRADRDRDRQQAADEAAIRGLHKQVLAGWNEASGDAFAAPFSEDADFVGFDGSVTRGASGSPRRIARVARGRHREGAADTLKRVPPAFARGGRVPAYIAPLTRSCSAST
jgi:hypothetical protein